MYKEPKLMHHILERDRADAVTAYLNAQIEAGAQAVMIFDSWGGALSHAAYHEFSLPYMQRIVQGLKREKDGVKIPSIVFTKGGGLWIESIADIGCDAVGLDWTMDIGVARQKVGHKVALAGQPRSERPVCDAGSHPQRSGKDTDQLRIRQRPCVQSGARDFAIHQPGQCCRAGAGGA